MCEEDVNEVTEIRKQKRENRKDIRKTNNKKKKRRENKNLLIQINRQKTDNSQSDRQTVKRTNRHKSFIDMRYYTEQYSKSNSIK